jgi:hypothetical protein
MSVVNWDEIGHANDVVAMAAINGKLFAATKDNKLWWRDPVGQNVNWDEIGHANDAVAMTQARGKLFAATNDDKLWWREPVGIDVNWIQIGHANAVVAMAALRGKLFAATSDNKLWWRDPVSDIIGSIHINWPWAIVLCRFNDLSIVPREVAFYEDLFTRSGTGDLCDYWRCVSFDALDLTQSKVFGWYTMSHASSEVSHLHFPADRSTLVRWGLDTAVANGVNLAAFRSVLIVQNFGVDHGAAGNGILIVHQNADLCEFGFISHEMGHGFGLPHSNSANPDMVYGDGWDVMSFATTTFQFPIEFEGAKGDATVGLNARNLEALGAVPLGRTWIPFGPDFSEQIVLDPLNQSPLGNHGALIAKFPPSATMPWRTNGSSYTAEFRRKAGCDRNIPEDAVLVHEVRSNGLSYLQPVVWGRFIAGQEFTTPDPKIVIRVVSIDALAGKATLRVWDIPEGSLRKEDSKPQVYLIQGGMKRWITSPQVLFAFGKSWSDVRVVPDGALNSLPAGPNLV